MLHLSIKLLKWSSWRRGTLPWVGDAISNVTLLYEYSRRMFRSFAVWSLGRMSKSKHELETVSLASATMKSHFSEVSLPRNCSVKLHIGYSGGDTGWLKCDFSLWLWRKVFLKHSMCAQSEFTMTDKEILGNGLLNFLSTSVKCFLLLSYQIIYMDNLLCSHTLLFHTDPYPFLTKLCGSLAF